jgi:subtilase family serine protease
MSVRRRVGLRPHFEPFDGRCLLSGLTPAQVVSAYGLGSLSFSSSSGATVKGDGSGETIALVEAYHDPYLAGDLQVFDRTFNLPAASLSVVNQAGGRTNNDWAAEETLDVEWAHAIAPGANLLVVEAASQSVTDLMAAVNLARNAPGVVAVSMSWGFSETANETSYDSYFTTPAGHTGVTFLAASGDSGALAGASYPSSSPNVVSVGGTRLNVNFSGSYQGESAWIDSGGGYSAYEKEPAYQAAVQSTHRRSTPDVAFDADPDSGVAVYQTPLRGGQGVWQTVGGTSLGTPAWAAIVAIVDQGRAVAGRGSLDGPSQTLPTLYGLAPTSYHSVSGASFGGFSGFGFNLTSWPTGGFSTSTVPSATKSGANTATGLGSPIGPALVSGLVDSNTTTPLIVVSGNGSSGAGSKSPHSTHGTKHHQPIRRPRKKPVKSAAPRSATYPTHFAARLTAAMKLRSPF